MTREATAKSTVKAFQAKYHIASLRNGNGCKKFHELIDGIRTDVENNVYTYAQIGVTEIELLELGLINARLNCIHSSSNFFASQSVVRRYFQELVQLRRIAGCKTTCIA